MGTALSNGPIPSVSPSFPDTQIVPPPPPPPRPQPFPASRVGPTVIPSQFKYFYIAFPFMTQMSTGPTTATSPFPPVLNGVPVSPNQGAKGSTKIFVLGQLALRIFDPVRNNGIAGNSVAPVSTPSQCTKIDLTP